MSISIKAKFELKKIKFLLKVAKKLGMDVSKDEAIIAAVDAAVKENDYAAAILALAPHVKKTPAQAAMVEAIAKLKSETEANP